MSLMLSLSTNSPKKLKRPLKVTPFSKFAFQESLTMQQKMISSNFSTHSVPLNLAIFWKTVIPIVQRVFVSSNSTTLPAWIRLWKIIVLSTWADISISSKLKENKKEPLSRVIEIDNLTILISRVSLALFLLETWVSKLMRIHYRTYSQIMKELLHAESLRTMREIAEVLPI